MFGRKIYNNTRHGKVSPENRLVFLSKVFLSAGYTGIPFVDANMREIMSTGWMSNRGRQNVASFLTKDLGIDWRFVFEQFFAIVSFGLID